MLRRDMNLDTTFLQSVLDNFPISSKMAETYFYVCLTILAAILIDNVLRALIKLPQQFETKRAQTYVSVIKGIITTIVYIIAINLVFIELNINITPLLASAGVIGVVIGMGGRAIIEDLLSGVILLSQHTIRLGDYVKLDEQEGYIQSIGLRTLTLRSNDGALHIIPNGLVKKIVNYSQSRSDVVILFPIKSDQKLDPVIQALTYALEQTQKDEEVGHAFYPGSQIDGIDAFEKFGAMNVRVCLVTNPSMRWQMQWVFQTHAKKAFEKYKISLA